MNTYPWPKWSSFLFAAFCLVTASNTQAQTGANAASVDGTAPQNILAVAGTLIKDGKSAQAYTLLLPLQSERAGDPEYDYLLGIAALDSGKATEAIFALERVLAVNPGHLQARAEIARAYLAAGEVTAATQEFNAVKQQNPPGEVSATIQKYLDIIETSRTGRATTFKGYVEATIGDDSNVNSATASNQVAIPAFGGTIWDLKDDDVKKRDEFGSIATGFSVRHIVATDWVIFGGAGLNQRMNSTKDSFDTRNMDGTLGANHTKNDSNYSLALQVQRFDIDNNRYRDHRE